MGFRTIENDIKSGVLNKAAPVLLCGEEQFLVNYYEHKLVALFSGRKDSAVDDNSSLSELDISVFYGDEADDEAIMAALDTFPIFLPARIVLVRNHQGFQSAGGASNRGGGKSSSASETASEKITQKKNGLADFILHIPETARLVFTVGGVNKTRALYKAIAKHGTVYEFTRLNEADLINFVRKRFKTMGADAGQDVLDAFIYATGYLEKDSGGDLFTVENDVYKTASFALSEGRTTIAHSDVEECLPGVLRTDVFAMLDAISTGRKAEAIRLLENSLAGGENVFRLLSLFTGHFEIMLGYKELSAEGHSSAKITQILGERSDWRVKKLGGFAQRFELKKLQTILRRLYETERMIKSGDIAERLALTVLLAGL